jgi:hypothetical protein
MSTFGEISALVNSIEIFDTHEHLAGFDWGFSSPEAPIGPTHPRQKSLPHVLMNDMLLYLIPSTGLPSAHLSPDQWPIERAGEYWRALQPALEELRSTTVYTLIRRGLKELYGFDGDEITDENWAALNEKIVATYRDKGASQWLLETARRARVQAMVQMAHLPYLLDYWPSLDAERSEREQALIRPSLVLEPFIFSGFEPDRTRARERTLELLNCAPRTLEEHLEFCHAALQAHKNAGGVAVKFICAYQRTLHFDNVADDEARPLYARGVSTLDKAQLARLQDNIAWHLVRMARDLELPIQIHTGYSLPSALGHPETLFDMVTHPDLRGAQFYFAHAGWPHEGVLALMARTYANVHFGFCWIPGLSPALYERMLSEMIDLLPANKMLVGMDCGGIEVFYGTTLVTREILAKVLAKKVDDGQLSRRAAQTVAHRILHDNGARLFGRPRC